MWDFLKALVPILPTLFWVIGILIVFFNLKPQLVTLVGRAQGLTV
jgi:hypothetical protein